MNNCFSRLLAFLLLLFAAPALAQDYNYQLSVISDNDNYTFKRKDRYYTNGLMLRFAKPIKDESLSGVKKIWTLEGGQKIFNPFKQNKDFMETMDRPFTGFLYLKSGVTSITPKENVFRWSALAGVIGKAALGKEVQQWHHRNFGLSTPHGWETQLKSEPVVNLQAAYYRHILLSSTKDRIIDAHLKAEINAGTAFTNATAGALFKLGAFEKAAGSTHWDARLHQYKPVYRRNYEFYFYFEPALTYQAFNATIQGGLFTHEKDFYTTSIEPLYYSHSFGLVYAKTRWTLQMAFTYKTKEATSMRAHENFGSLGLAYRFN